MLRSMTGFGAGVLERDGLAVRAEVRSVNHRFLQVKIKLPPELIEHEALFEQELRRRLERGALTASVSIESGAGAGSVGVDLVLARQYQSLVVELGAALGLKGDLSLERYAALPGVLGPQAAHLGAENVLPIAFAALGRAIDSLLEMRAREGTALAVELGRHVDVLAERAAEIEGRMPLVVQRLHEALKKRVALLLTGSGSKPVAEPDLARELALLADRADVSEELARLGSHMAQVRLLLAGGAEGVGRRLDFLVQELLREVNTIGSKCNDADVALWVVDAKATVERLREQVQNVE